MYMKSIFKLVIAVAAALAALPAVAALNVFACEPEWGALAQELAGDRVSVYSGTTALQDPHRIEARPSLVAQMRNAQLVICTGAGLESGWLPVLMQTAGNRAVLPGTRGYVAAADYVDRLEIPAQLDRAAGDIHAGGNPHIHLDPHNVAKVATVVTARLAELDPRNAAGYAARGEDFQRRWRDAMTRWEVAAQPLRGMRLVPYHRDLVYLFAWLGMVDVADIEPKPGIPPSAGYLSELIARITRDGADAVARSTYADPKASEWVAQHTHLPLVELPYTVGGTPAAGDLFALFDDTLARLAQARH